MRPTKEETCLKTALLWAERGTCARRKVGCVLVNSLGHVLATGYNGVAKSLSHCTDHPCGGANLPSGTGLDSCEAIHAEQNALLQCGDTQKIETCYVTASPCLHCIKLLMNTGCKQIVFLEEYPGHEKAKALWQSSRKPKYPYVPWKKYAPSQQVEMNFAPAHPRKFGNLSW